jgi:hypothetical protein
MNDFSFMGSRTRLRLARFEVELRLSCLQVDGKCSVCRGFSRPGYPETLGFQVLSLRQSLPSQESPRPFGTAEKPRKRGLLLIKLLTAASARNAILVSLSPVVSKAPDFAILVRNFKQLILNGYSVREIRTFRIPLVGASGAQIETRLSGQRELAVPLVLKFGTVRSP